jgi:serine/threonine protein kinase
MKTVINPRYEYLHDWIENMPFLFEKEGEIIYKKRNTIKMFLLDNRLIINVKRFHKPHFFNRILYTFFIKSKAFRSYCHTLRIFEKGFDAAEAVAYMEINEGGLLSDSYYISLQCRNVREIREYYAGPLAGNETLIDAFARYSAALHDAGIYHLDYSPGNILIRNDSVSGEYSFILVDVNRMKFMSVGTEKGCKNFARLFGNDDINKRIGVVYSQSRKNIFDKEKAIRLILKYKNRLFRKKAQTAKLKRFFKV